MTPKDKAREMVDKIHEGLWRDRAVRICQEDAVYTALIAVDEIIKVIKVLDDAYYNDEQYGYWTDVREELDNL